MTEGIYLQSLKELGQDESNIWGNKAVRLSVLSKSGFDVPEGFCLSTNLFFKVIDELLLPEEKLNYILKDVSDELASYDRLASIRAKINSCVIPLEIKDNILQKYKEMGGGFVAVRSSATTEDNISFSAAGMQDSFLNVKGDKQILEAIKSVWASLWNPRVINYLNRINFKGEPAVAVLIQNMINCDKAGVMFTSNPVNRKHDEIIINATSGLGMKVVDGSIDPDSYILNKKELNLKFQKKGQITSQLDESTLNKLSSIGLEIEKLFNRPQDIEWGIIDNKIHIIQARDIIFPSLNLDKYSEEELLNPKNYVWSNVNVGEALPGVATPLTWSIALRFSELGFIKAFGALGCKVPTNIQLVGNFYGRIYLNLTEFMRIVRQVPFMTVDMWLDIGGGVEHNEAKEILKSFETTAGTSDFWLNIHRTILTLLKEYLLLENNINKFENDFTEYRSQFNIMQLSQLSNKQLFAIEMEVENLLNNCGALMFTVSSHSLSAFVVLRYILKKSLPQQDVQKGLDIILGGIKQLESAAPGIDLWHIAQLFKQDNESLNILLNSKPEEISISSFKSEGEVKRAIEKFLQAYGYRSMREAELSTPRWSEDPSFIFLTLQKYVKVNHPSPADELEAKQLKREEFLIDINKQLNWVKSAALNKLIALYIKLSRYRERLRARVTEILHFFRIIALEVDKRLGSKGNIFFLTIEEIEDFLKENKNIDYLKIIKERQKQYEVDIAMPDPPDIFIANPKFGYTVTDEIQKSFTGIGVSGGIVSGIARIISKPEDVKKFEEGEILVVPSADVGWTPLFIIAKGLIMEKGGILSHASIVAREFGLPAVVNVPKATKKIKTGQKITIDGWQGRIIIEE